MKAVVLQWAFDKWTKLREMVGALDGINGCLLIEAKEMIPISPNDMIINEALAGIVQ